MSLSRKIILVVMVMGLMYYIDPSRADDRLKSFKPETVERPIKPEPEALQWGQELEASDNLCNVDSMIENGQRNDLCESSDLESSPVKKKLPSQEARLNREDDPQHFKIKKR